MINGITATRNITLSWKYSIANINATVRPNEYVVVFDGFIFNFALSFLILNNND